MNDFLQHDVDDDVVREVHDCDVLEQWLDEDLDADEDVVPSLFQRLRQWFQQFFGG